MGDNWSILLNLSMYRWGGVFRVRLNILGMLEVYDLNVQGYCVGVYLFLF